MPKGEYLRTRNVWRPEWDEALRNVVGKPGVSFAMVRDHMRARFPNDYPGKGWTRNTVLGRASRLGLKSGVAKNGEAGVGRPMGRTRRKPQEKMVTIRHPRYVPGEVREDCHNVPIARLEGASKHVRRATKEQIALRRLGHVPQIVEDAPHTSKPLLECGERECKWPTSTDVRCMEVCGQPATYGAYCDRHGSLAYRIAPTRKRNGIYHKDDAEFRVRLEHEHCEPAANVPSLAGADAPPMLMLDHHDADEDQDA